MNGVSTDLEELIGEFVNIGRVSTGDNIEVEKGEEINHGLSVERF